MTEYIITEERLQNLRALLFPKDIGGIDEWFVSARSRPYTNEREKVLDYMINYIDTHTDAVHGTVTSIRRVMVELRKQGEQR